MENKTPKTNQLQTFDIVVLFLEIASSLNRPSTCTSHPAPAAHSTSQAHAGVHQTSPSHVIFNLRNQFNNIHQQQHQQQHPVSQTAQDILPFMQGLSHQNIERLQQLGMQHLIPKVAGEMNLGHLAPQLGLGIQCARFCQHWLSHHWHHRAAQIALASAQCPGHAHPDRPFKCSWRHRSGESARAGSAW